MGSHLIDDEFQSDEYPTMPRGKVPLSVKDVTAQDLLWTYAQRRRAIDAEFADDLEVALRAAGFEPIVNDDPVDRCDFCPDGILLLTCNHCGARLLCGRDIDALALQKDLFTAKLHAFQVYGHRLAEREQFRRFDTMTPQLYAAIETADENIRSARDVLRRLGEVESSQLDLVGDACPTADSRRSSR